MSQKGAQLLDEVLLLTPQERAEFADRILSSLDFPADHKIEGLWAEEAERRLNAYERGQIRTISSREVFRETSVEKR